MSFQQRVTAKWHEDVYKAQTKITELLESFKKYGHELELLGSSDELMIIDDARKALKTMLQRVTEGK
jgi:UDP-N-acetylmuramoylalanine-D-glutamate ligase